MPVEERQTLETPTIMSPAANPILIDPKHMLWIADYPSHGRQRFPTRPAIVSDEETMSYTELDQHSNRFAATLAARGLRAGDRIAYLGKNNALFFPVFFGCLRSGVVLVPINFRCSAAEIRFILENSGSRLLIFDRELRETVHQAVAGLAEAPTPLPLEGEEDSLRRLLTTGGEEAPRPAAADPDACALLMYTSGTTGVPKGVMLSHRAISLARHVEVGVPAWADWTDDDVILSAMPNFHVGGLSWMLIGMLRSVTCVLTANASPAHLLSLTRRHAVTRTFMVPTVVRALLEELTRSTEPAPQLKTIYYGASTMDVALLSRCIATFGCGFAQFFGMTENSGTVTFLPPVDHDASRPGRLRSVGKALAGMELAVRDASGKVQEAGVPGELWVRSPTMMLGYWKRPDATAEVLIDGWYRTGDGGQLDADGYLYLTDRIKDMIISGGENVYPVEVEQALRQHPAIRDVVVIGMPDPVWGEAITAVVEWHEGQTASLDDLRAFARQHIAGYKLPKRLRTMPSLPRTATGKLRRGEVRKSMKETADDAIG